MFSAVGTKYRDMTRKVLALFADMWSEELESIDVVQHRTNLTKNSR